MCFHYPYWERSSVHTTALYPTSYLFPLHPLSPRPPITSYKLVVITCFGSCYDTDFSPPVEFWRPVPSTFLLLSIPLPLFLNHSLIPWANSLWMTSVPLSPSVLPLSFSFYLLYLPRSNERYHTVFSFCVYFTNLFSRCIHFPENASHLAFFM